MRRRALLEHLNHLPPVAQRLPQKTVYLSFLRPPLLSLSQSEGSRTERKARTEGKDREKLQCEKDRGDRTRGTEVQRK